MARIVANLGPFDLDHLGAKVGKILPTPGAGEYPGQVENTQMRQGTGHHRGLVQG